MSYLKDLKEGSIQNTRYISFFVFVPKHILWDHMKDRKMCVVAFDIKCYYFSFFLAKIPVHSNC